MAQSGYTPILIYASGTATNVPLAADMTSTSTGAELAINYADGKLYYKNSSNVVTLLASTSGASGDVVGPASATDNALARFDLTTGKLIQNSVGILSDAGILTGLTGLTSSGSITLSSLTSGRVTYAGTAGLLQDSANLTFNGTTLTANTIGAYTLSGTIAGGGNQINNVIIGTSTPLAGSFTSVNATSITDSGLTSGRVTYAGASGLLSDSANLVFNGTNLGIGAGVTPNKDITIYKASTDAEIRLQAGTNDFYLSARNSGGQFDMFNASNAGITFGTNNLERMRITSAGNVGIGTTSPAAKLQVNADTDTIKTYGTYYNQLILDCGSGGFSQAVWLVNAVTYALVGAGGGNMLLNTGGNSTANMIFSTGSGTTERMRIDSSGNVGIGTTTMTSLLNVNGDVRIGNGGDLRISNSISPSTTANDTFLYNDGATPTFITWVNGAERMRIDSSGNLLVGCTSAPSSSVSGVIVKPSGVEISAGSGTGLTYLMAFINGNGTVGNINVNGSTTTYATSSDYRLKEDVQLMTGALAKVAQLKPVTYKWKADGSDGQGFIAHELAEVMPDCVLGQKDAVKADGSIMPQGVDTSFLVATLVSAIQEQQALIESLTTRLTALENK